MQKSDFYKSDIKLDYLTMSSSRMAGSWTVSRSHAVDVKLAATFPVEKGAALNLSALAVD